jgi:hypothetical protein
MVTGNIQEPSYLPCTTSPAHMVVAAQGNPPHAASLMRIPCPPRPSMRRTRPPRSLLTCLLRIMALHRISSVIPDGSDAGKGTTKRRRRRGNEIARHKVIPPTECSSQQGIVSVLADEPASVMVAVSALESVRAVMLAWMSVKESALA